MLFFVHFFGEQLKKVSEAFDRNREEWQGEQGLKYFQPKKPK